MYAGILITAYPVLTVLASRGYQSYQNWAYFNSSSDVPAPPTAAPKVPTTILGRLEIPRVGLSVMIVEGVNEPELLLGAGHIPGTARPGLTGNAGIAGHRDTYFRPLKDIRVSDEIRISTREGNYRYVVEATRITTPSDVAVLNNTPEGRLTLVTCYPFSFLGSAPDRFVVQARLVPPPNS
jgi:sortase A